MLNVSTVFMILAKDTYAARLFISLFCSFPPFFFLVFSRLSLLFIFSFFFFFARRDLDWSDSFSSSLFLECRHFEIPFVFYTAMFQWLLLRGCS